MKAIIFGLLLFSGIAQAKTNNGAMTPAKASQRIAEAVKAIKPLAYSGVQQYRVRPAKTVKEFMQQLAEKERGESEKEFNESWKGSSNDAWETDSAAWGETTMRAAYNYVFDLLDGEELTEKNKLDREKARQAWELFLHTGVKFGVAPLGAVQCGISFGGLAIIDPHTGKIYVFSKEPSGGC